MLEDLKHFKVDDDSEDGFQLIASEAAGTILLILGVLIGLFWPHV